MNLVNILTCTDINIDPIVPGTVRLFVNILKVAIPIILIVLGVLDLAKAVMANDEKEMKEAQKKLIKRIVYAVIVFFVVALVQFVFGKLADADNDTGTNINRSSVSDCIACFITDSKQCAK